jgi:ADP-heptose:LPS heptosyltransferase
LRLKERKGTIFKEKDLKKMAQISIKNFFISLLLRCLHGNTSQKKKESDSPPTDILIVSTTGLGDTLWATPVIKSIKKKYPKICISLLTTPAGKEVFENNPDISNIYLFKKPSLFSFFFLWKKLQNKRFDSTYVFHTSQRLVLPLLSLLNTSKIIGFEGVYKGWQHILTEKIETTVSLHEAEKRYLLFRDFFPLPKEDSLFFFPTSRERERMKKFLLSFPKKSLSFAFHPGAKDFYKCWPKEYFVELGKKLLSSYDCNLFITGGKEERKLLSFLTKNLDGAIPIHNLSIRELAAFLENMDLFVTNDTGPMHLATSLQIPTIVIFSPTDPKICGPYGKNQTYVLQKPPLCKPCLKRKCKNSKCLQKITPDEVFHPIEAFITKGSFL